MTAAERVALIRTKVERAKEHFSDLESEVARFLNGNNPGAYEIGTKQDSQTRELLYYILSVGLVPARISALAGDALQNCRTALDHLAYQFFLVGSPGRVPSRRISFPIFDDASTYHAEKFRKIQGMRKDAIDFFDAIEPYKGGNDLLWCLHRLNNIDKHRLLLAAVIGVQGHSLTEVERADLRARHGAAAEKVRFLRSWKGSMGR